MSDLDDLLATLRAGNEGYVRSGGQPSTDAVDPSAIPSRSPRLTVLACSDLRAIPEQVLGLEPGDLYIVQTPGVACTERDVQSLELYASQASAALLVVLGHAPCRVIEHSLETDEGPIGEYSEEIRRSFQLADEASIPPGHNDACAAHAARIARKLSAEFKDSSIRVEAALLDEDDGRVQFMPLH